MNTVSTMTDFDDWKTTEAEKMRCPNCGSEGVLRHEASRATIFFPCGAYAFKEMWDKHGGHSLIDTNASCDYIYALRKAKSMIEQNHSRIVDYKGQLIGGGGHGHIKDTYQAICEVLP